MSAAIEELSRSFDPWSTFRRIAHLPHAIFFDSAVEHHQLGRFSFMAADPFGFVRARRQQVAVRGLTPPVWREPANPWNVLAELLARFPADTVPGLPPFQGGAAGLFGYDLCHHLERLPRPAHDEFEMPDMAIGFYDWVIAFDHEQRQSWLFSTGLPEIDPPTRKARAEQRLQWVMKLLSTTAFPRRTDASRSPITPAHHVPVPAMPGVFSNFDRASYLSMVRRAIEYTHAGDCFQVNLAQRLLHPTPADLLDLYGKLRERNPAPFAGYFDLGDFVICSASPERFLHIENGLVTTRPIKGTRPRGDTPEQDAARIAELQASAKDRAENIMIVDLLRNDLGRVCRYGSVGVESVCLVETYRTVHHLVSEVQGRLRAGLGPIDALRAAFPGGSVTGAPKIRAMEIIAELEATARGPYCGCLGWIGFNGSMDTSILIRTMTLGRGWLQFPVGGGIVADSVPEREYEETWHKAEGMLRALQ